MSWVLEHELTKPITLVNIFLSEVDFISCGPHFPIEGLVCVCPNFLNLKIYPTE